MTRSNPLCVRCSSRNVKMVGRSANGMTQFRCDTCQKEWGEMLSARQNATITKQESLNRMKRTA